MLEHRGVYIALTKRFGQELATFSLDSKNDAIPGLLSGQHSSCEGEPHHAIISCRPRVATRDGEAPVNPKATKVLPSWFAAFLRCNPRSSLDGGSLPIIRPLVELSFLHSVCSTHRGRLI
jgi:hypothetical protein